MNPTKRVVINTGAQYARALINIILSLYSTRLILEALGKDDYGLYVLVGGIVAMLGFVTNALIVSTQRFISFYQYLQRGHTMAPAEPITFFLEF